MPAFPSRLTRLITTVVALSSFIHPNFAAADAAADQVFALVNQQRALNGLPPLARNSSLDQSAQSYAQLMATQNFFGHYGLNGNSNPPDRMAAAGYTGAYAWGENIAAGYQTAADVMTGWMNSSGHRANILSSSFQDIGIGVAYGGSYGTYWVQDFGARSGSTPPVTPSPPPVTIPPSPTTPSNPPSPTTPSNPPSPTTPSNPPSPTTPSNPPPPTTPTGSIAGASMFISAINGAAYHSGQATIHVGQTVTLTLLLKYSSGATSDVSTGANTKFVTDPVRGTFLSQNVWSPTTAEVNHSVTIYGIYTSPTGQRITTTVSITVRQ